MSGLLVKSTLIMRDNLNELNDLGLAHLPVLLGGAALTRTYVEKDLREVYEGRVFYGRDAFEGLESLPLPGPVFIHETDCARYREDGGFPEDLREHALTFNAYSRGRRLRAQEYVGDGRVERAIEGLLAREDVDYLHVRDTEAGCYDFRIERARRG